ncbi:MAG: substrate-binding periplasmic protein [bacterium]
MKDAGARKRLNTRSYRLWAGKGCWHLRGGLKGVLAAIAVVLGIGLLPLGGAGDAATSPTCRTLDTLEPGQIQVAIESFMPIIGEANGKLTGLDGDNITILAGDLGCRVKIFLSDSAGDLAAVQSHRVDVTIGSWGWTKTREQVMLASDPLYYQPVVLAQRKGAAISHVSQLSGHTLCTLTGFVFIPAMHQVPRATIRTYPTMAAELLDIADGRCDVGFGNPLVIAYAESHNAALNGLTYQYLAQPTPAELKVAPLFATVASGYEDVVYLTPSERKLEAALHPLIDNLVTSGQEAKLMERWGITDPRFWLTPRDGLISQRIGVDRPSGWVAPRCSGSSCQ